MICDLAETYHVLNWRALPVPLVATLVFGLSQNSRVKMAIAKEEFTLEQLLLMKMTDQLSLLLWAQTKDGQKGRNKPALLLSKKEQSKIESFPSIENYEKARKEFITSHSF